MINENNVRYCYACGNIGEVDVRSVSCCPDAPGTVGYVTERFARSLKRNDDALRARVTELEARIAAAEKQEPAAFASEYDIHTHLPGGNGWRECVVSCRRTSRFDTPLYTRPLPAPVAEAQCKWTPNTPDACPYCTGEACAKCGPDPIPPCKCDVVARHERATSPAPVAAVPVDIAQIITAYKCGMASADCINQYEHGTHEHKAFCYGVEDKGHLNWQAAQSQPAVRLSKDWYLRNAKAEGECAADVGAGFATLPTQTAPTYDGPCMCARDHCQNRTSMPHPTWKCRKEVPPSVQAGAWPVAAVADVKSHPLHTTPVVSQIGQDVVHNAQTVAVRDAEIARIVDAMESVAGPGAPYPSASVPSYAVLGWAEQIRAMLAAKKTNEE